MVFQDFSFVEDVPHIPPMGKRSPLLLLFPVTDEVGEDFLFQLFLVRTVRVIWMRNDPIRINAVEIGDGNIGPAGNI